MNHLFSQPGFQGANEFFGKKVQKPSGQQIQKNEEKTIIKYKKNNNIAAQKNTNAKNLTNQKLLKTEKKINKKIIENKIINLSNEKLLKIFTKGEYTNMNLIPTNITQKPIFVIKYGPPASGKGSSKVNEIIKKQGPALSTYIEVNVDDIIESNITDFTNESRKVIENMLKNRQKKSINNMTNTNYDKNLVSKLSAAYIGIRFGRKNKNGKKIGNRMDTVMSDAFTKGKNMIFETTGGTGTFDWLFTDNKYQGIRKYKIILIFPIVKKETMWERYKKRAIRTYKNDKGFRFTTTKEQIFESYEESYKNFINIVNDSNMKTKINEIHIVNNDSGNSNIKSKYGQIKKWNQNRMGRTNYIRNFKLN